jgi:predicted Zn-dependent peptidase
MPDPLQISETIEKTGGTLNAATEHESTIYWCKIVSDFTKQSLELLFDMLQNSLFNPKSIELERHVIIEELNGVNDDPSSRAEAILDELMWPCTALGRDIAGTKETVTSISREEILNFLSTHYVGSNIVLSVAGQLKHDQVVDAAQQYSANMSTGEKIKIPEIVSTQSSRQFRSEYRDTEQIHMSMGFPGVSRRDPDRYAVDLLCTILGEGMSSRLFNEIREKRGLAYDIGSGVLHFNDIGSIQVFAGLHKNKYEEAIDVIVSELDRCKYDVAESELNKVKSLVSGRLKLRLEDTQFVSGWNLSQELSSSEIRSPEEVLRNIEAVTVSDVTKVARKYMTYDRMNISIVGPVGETSLV